MAELKPLMEAIQRVLDDLGRSPSLSESLQKSKDALTQEHKAMAASCMDGTVVSPSDMLALARTTSGPAPRTKKRTKSARKPTKKTSGAKKKASKKKR